MNSRDKISVCEHEDRAKVDLHLCILYEKISALCGNFFTITSGLRCNDCNKKAGGSDNSSHLIGKAIDIHCISSRSRFRIITAASILGVKRIGIAPDHIHIDIDNTKDQELIWLED